jgi:cell division inhibitor SepF
MASAMRKMAVYLGLVEDDHRYDDPYTDEYGEGEDYGDYVTEYAAADHSEARDAHPAFVADGGADGRVRASRSERQHADLARITTLHHAHTMRRGRSVSIFAREHPLS